MAETSLLGGPENESEQEFEANAAAIAVAMDGARDNPALTAALTAFLAEQRALIAEQRHHLGEQVKRLRLGILDERVTIALKAMTAVVGLAVAVAVGIAMWTAAHDNGLVIEAFSVPPDMAARGLTGQAVAAQIQDKLAAMQNATRSSRPAESYANNWGDDIKVEIPETGVSIGQFYNLLVTWLGRQTHITGEVFRTSTGIAVTARGGGDGGAMVTGKDADLDKLLQQAAENIYERTQPYRYAIYIEYKKPPQWARAREILERLAAEGSPRDRAWAYNGLSALDNVTGDGERSAADARRAEELLPGFVLAYENIDFSEAGLGHAEQSLAAARAAVTALDRSDRTEMNERAQQVALPGEQSNVDFSLNDFVAARADLERLLALPDYLGSVDSARQSLIVTLALLHDGAGTRRALRSLPPSSDPVVMFNRAASAFTASYWLGDRQSTIAQAPEVERLGRKFVDDLGLGPAYSDGFMARQVWPYLAMAKAELGDFKGAHALVDRTPLDCYACVHARADIDTSGKNWGGAAYWFAEVVRQAPSIPMGYYRWGRMLFLKGDLDGAIAKLAVAHQKGPHFADPLEMWGEVLILQNRSDLALAKFAEAAQYAPNWGRLHLKWGEALLWSGKKDEAQKQFAIAAKLDLTNTERVELAHWKSPHG